MNSPTVSHNLLVPFPPPGDICPYTGSVSFNESHKALSGSWLRLYTRLTIYIYIPGWNVWFVATKVVLSTLAQRVAD